MNKIKKRESNFTTVSNEFLRDSRISFKAKGLFCYMFSMSDGWNFTIKSIASQQKDGYDSVQSALDELKQCGYIEYEKHSDGTGTYHLNDKPKTENPKQENPIMGKSTRIKKEQLDKNKKDIHPLVSSFIRCNNTNESGIEWATWFVNHRKAIKHPIKTIRPIEVFIKSVVECLKSGYTPQEIRDVMEAKEWQSLKLEWVQKEIVREKEWGNQ